MLMSTPDFSIMVEAILLNFIVIARLSTPGAGPAAIPPHDYDITESLRNTLFLISSTPDNPFVLKVTMFGVVIAF